MLTLFGLNGSGSAAAEMALMRCGVPYTVVRASTWEPESAQQPLREANPLQQIPTLQFDVGSVMTESAAILIEPGLRHPASGLLPQDAAARAQALRGLLSAAVVSRWSGTRVHLKAQRPALLALLQRVESQPDLAPAFARHWPG